MAAPDLYQRAFARAAQILGGRQALARYLATDLVRLKQWASRGARPPLHAVVSILHLLQQEWFRNYSRASRRAPARSK